MNYPKERILELAKQLPEPQPGGRAMAIDKEHDAVIEFRADAILNTWGFSGVYKAFATLPAASSGDESPSYDLTHVGL